MAFEIDSISRRLITIAFVAPFLWIGCNGSNNPVVLLPSATPTDTVGVGPTATATPAPVVGQPGAGVASEITDANVSDDGTITVTFTLTDDNGVPVEPVLSSTQDDNKARVRFIIAHVEEYSGGGELGNSFTRYVNDIDLTDPGFDSGGTLRAIDAAAGVYEYTFKTQLPAGYDPSSTYTIGEQVDRTVNGVRLGVNPVFDLVPDGGTPQIRQDTTTAQCNQCHDPLILHGNRREVRLCVLCHTAAAVDGTTGNSIEFKNMIHKIHAGKDLPSVVNGPVGSKYGIGRSAVFAEKIAEGEVVGVGFPRPLNDCQVCHAEGPTSDFYRTAPATQACATCHDDVNPSLQVTQAGPPGTNHFNAKGFADGDCAFCHTATADDEFDVSVPGAHVIPERSAQLAGLVVDLLNITDFAAGQTPTISFKVTDNEGTPLLDFSGLNRLGFTVAGPTTDYATVLTYTAAGGGASGMLSGPDGDGVFDYMPASGIPADATGTWAVSAEARRSVALLGPDGTTKTTVNEAAVNPPPLTFTVDDEPGLVRRTVVEITNCQQCHGEFSRGFSIHGGLRNQTYYCVMCHNPNNSDVSRRNRDPEAVARGDQVTSIDFKVMIHKIHTGENLNQKPYLIYGFGSAPLNYGINDFSEVRFPGDRRDCVKCHVEGTNLLSPSAFPGTALGTQVAHLDPSSGDLIVDGRLGPITSVCTACHDSDAAMTHAETQMVDGREACAVCHMEGRDVAVSEVHAR